MRMKFCEFYICFVILNLLLLKKFKVSVFIYKKICLLYIKLLEFECVRMCVCGGVKVKGLGDF